MKINWNYELVQKEALKFRTIRAWKDNSRRSYDHALNNNLIGEFSKHMEKPSLLTKDQVIEEANKYKTKKDWRDNSIESYNYAKEHKLINEIFDKIKPKRITWTRQMCLDSTLKYKTAKEWRVSELRSYSTAYKHGWKEDCYKNLVHNTPSSYWTKNKIIKEIKKYSTRLHFLRNCDGAYRVAKLKYPHLLQKYLPLIESSHTSVGENSTRHFLNKLFNTSFIKKRHNFLINPKTNRMMELDGYSDELKLAFEYGDHRALFTKKRDFKILNDILYKDELKIKLCKENGVKLLQLTIDSLTFSRPCEHIKNQILDRLIFHKIDIPDNFAVIPIKIVQFKKKKWKKVDIWKDVKDSRNITNFESKYRSSYNKARKLNMLDTIRAYYHKRNGTKPYLQNRPIKSSKLLS